MSEYAEFLGKVRDLLTEAMADAGKSRDRLEAAESELHELQAKVATAEARVKLLRGRYERDRELLTEIWGTWRSEYEKEAEVARGQVGGNALDGHVAGNASSSEPPATLDEIDDGLKKLPWRTAASQANR